MSKEKELRARAVAFCEHWVDDPAWKKGANRLEGEFEAVRLEAIEECAKEAEVWNLYAAAAIRRLKEDKDAESD